MLWLGAWFPPERLHRCVGADPSSGGSSMGTGALEAQCSSSEGPEQEGRGSPGQRFGVPGVVSGPVVGATLLLLLLRVSPCVTGSRSTGLGRSRSPGALGWAQPAGHALPGAVVASMGRTLHPGFPVVRCLGLSRAWAVPTSSRCCVGLLWGRGMLLRGEVLK